MPIILEYLHEHVSDHAENNVNVLCPRVHTVVWIEPAVIASSDMKLSKPTRMVATLQDGFHVCIPCQIWRHYVCHDVTPAVAEQTEQAMMHWQLSTAMGRLPQCTDCCCDAFATCLPQGGSWSCSCRSLLRVETCHLG